MATVIKHQRFSTESSAWEIFQLPKLKVRPRKLVRHSSIYAESTQLTTKCKVPSSLITSFGTAICILAVVRFELILSEVIIINDLIHICCKSNFLSTVTLRTSLFPELLSKYLQYQRKGCSSLNLTSQCYAIM